MTSAERPQLEVQRPGRVDYADGLRLQDALVSHRQQGEGHDTLVLLEHPKVLTLGRNSHDENVLLDADALSERGFEVHEVGRGGDVTYHGPGQLVGYPILRLVDDERDAHAYLRRIEQVLIDAAWTIEGPQGAAAILGIAPSTLRSRMKKLGIQRR